MVKLITYIVIFVFLVVLCCMLTGATVGAVIASIPFLIAFCAFRR